MDDDIPAQPVPGIHRVAVPAYDQRDRCWAVLAIKYKADPEVEICGGKPRPGRLTCLSHMDREDDAQDLAKRRGIA